MSVSRRCSGCSGAALKRGQVRCGLLGSWVRPGRYKPVQLVERACKQDGGDQDRNERHQIHSPTLLVSGPFTSICALGSASCSDVVKFLIHLRYEESPSIFFCPAGMNP